MNATKKILITASGSKIATTIPAETTVKKQSLDLKVDISGRTATVSFKTDISISPQI